MIRNRFLSMARTAAALAAGLFMLAAAPAGAYNNWAAWSYAQYWYNSSNPAYTDYRNQFYFHEDANFVSQALIAGGLLEDVPTLSWYPDTVPERYELYHYLSAHEHGESIVKPAGLPGDAWPGDVIFFGPNADDLKLVGLYLGLDANQKPLVAWHNPSLTGPVGSITGLDELQLIYGGSIFFHFTRPEETPDAQRFYASGLGFYGDNVLSAQVIRPGYSYLGYIVTNSNHGNQDLVVGTDTSGPQFSGCSYLIAAYCCDPHKGVPDEGEAMSQPWTSDSPADYAYWVRKAMEYAVPRGYGAWDILDAVWYISSGEGIAGDITQAIGFPGDILPKGEMKNGTFEAGTTLPAFWTGSNLGARDARVTGVAHTGTASFRMRGGARTKSLIQTAAFAGGAGDILTLSGWSKARGAVSYGGAYRIAVTVHYDGQPPRLYKKGFPKRTHGWMSRQLVITAEAPYSSVDVSLVYARQAGSAWFDDVQLVWEHGYATEKALLR